MRTATTRASYLTLLLGLTAAAAQAGDATPGPATDAGEVPAAAAAPEVDALLHPQRPPQEQFIRQRQARQMTSAELVGLDVTNSRREDVGHIEDLILDRQGQLVGVVLSVGGFFGFGDKLVALPWRDIAVEPADGIAVVRHSRVELETAPPYVPDSFARGAPGHAPAAAPGPARQTAGAGGGRLQSRLERAAGAAAE